MSTIWVCSDCGSTDIQIVYYGATVTIGQDKNNQRFLIEIGDYSDIQLGCCNNCGNTRYCNFESKEDYESKLQPPIADKLMFKDMITLFRNEIDALRRNFDPILKKGNFNRDKYRYFDELYMVMVKNYNRAWSYYDNSNLKEAQELLDYMRKELAPKLKEAAKDFMESDHWQ